MPPASFDGQSPRQILDSIVADGKVDDSEAAALRQCLDQDWVIDRAEAELMFEINRRTDDQSSSESWHQCFVDSITKFVLYDLGSPGEIDQLEGDWLADQLSPEPDLAEQTLLREIKKNSTLIAGKLADRLLQFDESTE